MAAMGARVLHTSTTDDGSPAWRTLPELLTTSDIVSLHLPLTPLTEGLLDRAALASMKSTAVLVNTSRGGVVDEAALVDALRAGQLAAAGLDVFAVEPVRPDNPLLRLDNVVVYPTRGVVHERHHAPLPVHGGKQLPAPARRAGSGQRG